MFPRPGASGRGGMGAPLTVWVQDREMTPAASSLGTQIVPYWWDWKKFHKDLLSSLARGQAPDLVEVGNTWTSRLIGEGVLFDISGFAAEQLNVAGQFFPRMLRYCTHPVDVDRLYALPLLADVRVLFYNSDYLDPYLAETPDALSNWKAFEAMCQTLQSRLTGEQSVPHDLRDRYVIAWPLGRDALHDALPWIWTMGGDIVAESGEVLLDSPQTQQAFARLARLILTGCAPLPPHQPVSDLGLLQAQFLLARRIAIIGGTLWVMREQDAHSRFKAVLHPPDKLPTAFLGGSNVAVVRKYGGDETSEDYDRVKELLRSMFSVDNQVLLARLMGKMPCTIPAWREMKRQAEHAGNGPLMDVFDRAMSYTVDRGLPNVPNLVQIEEDLKTCVQTIWRRVGEIKTQSPRAPLDELELQCGRAIAEELAAAKQRIQPYLGSFTVQYSRQEVQELELEPPGIFDIWLDIHTVSPRWIGDIYVRGKKGRVSGIGHASLQVLRTLLSARNRTLSREELVRDVWGSGAGRDHQTVKQIDEQLTELVTSIRGLSSVDRLADISKKLGSVVQIGEDIQRTIRESDELSKTIETLRKDVANVNTRLGPIRGQSVIERVRERDELRYRLHPDVSVCVVLPDGIAPVGA